MSIISDRIYRTSFLRNYNNLSSLYADILPNDIKEVITWSEFIIANVPLVSSAIEKMSSVSITSFQYNADDMTELGSTDVDSWKNIMENKLKILNRTQEFAYTFLTAGNVFCSIYYPIERTMECGLCNEKISQKKFTEKHKLRPKLKKRRNDDATIKDLYFDGTCPDCKKHSQFKHYDINITAPERMNIISWPAVNINLEDDPITGRASYYYSMPTGMRTRIRSGHLDTIFHQLPEMIVSAMNKKMVKFNQDKLLHIKRKKMDGASTGWGMPILTSAIPDMISLLLLRKGQERILSDMIFPLRGVVPRQTGNDGNQIYNYVSGSDVATKIETLLKSHTKNPTDIKYFPIPLDTMSAFGEGKTLNLAKEIDETSVQAMNAIGVPIEFVKGGLSFATGGASLRVLETQLQDLVSSMEEIVNFVARGVSGLTGKSEVSIKITPFKILDDIAEKQILLGLHQMGKVSDHTMAAYFKLDSQSEAEKQVEEAKANARNNMTVQKFNQEISQSLEEKAKTEAYLANSSSQQLNQEALRQEAEQVAEQFKQMEGGQRKSAMDSLQKENFVLWAMVKASLEIGGRKDAYNAAQEAKQEQQDQAQAGGVGQPLPKPTGVKTPKAKTEGQ